MTCESISIQMNVDEVDFMIQKLVTKLEHQKHVITILKSKVRSAKMERNAQKIRDTSLTLKTAIGRQDKIQNDIEFLHVFKKQLEMSEEDDQWLLDSPVYLSTIQQMRLKYASLIAAAARL